MKSISHICYNLSMNRSKWTVENYVKANGIEPVEVFLDTLPPKDEAKVLRSIQLLEEFGNELKKPHFEYMGNGLYELRTKVASNIHRVLYFHYKHGRYILLHGFTKKTKKTPHKELAKARRYMKDYLERAEKGALH